jgi:uncharacterized SAM-binding protein YcdF (DUF218 family)
MSIVFSKILPPLIFPDGLTCLLLFVVILTVRSKPRAALSAATAALVLLLVASTPLVSNLLVGSIEDQSAAQTPPPAADAIVVLAAGARPAEPPEPSVAVSGAMANRLLYAAKLYRDGKAPIVILSGGQLPWRKALPPLSAEMAEVIEMLGVPSSAVVQESESGNTYQNAIRTKAILERRNLRRILLVTSALHMPRALALFRQQGVETVPAPTDFISTSTKWADDSSSWQDLIISLLPSAEALQLTTQALKELLGSAVYRIAGPR